MHDVCQRISAYSKVYPYKGRKAYVKLMKSYAEKRVLFRCQRRLDIELTSDTFKK